MNLYDVIIYLIITAMAVLVMMIAFVIIKKPKEILFGFLVFIKPISGNLWSTINILTFPIWGPVTFLDKKYNWGIYSEDSGFTEVFYATEKSITIPFKDYKKYIRIEDSNLHDIKKCLLNCMESTSDLNLDGCSVNCEKDIVFIQLPNSVSFFNFHLIIQWLSTYLKQNGVFGIALNHSNSEPSYFVVSDRTGKYKNSLTGMTSKGDKFSINLIYCSNGEENLSVNSSIKLDGNINLEKTKSQIMNLNFEEFRL